MIELDTNLPCGDIALDEKLDFEDPLRHLKDDNELEGVIASEGLARSSKSVSELLTIESLPKPLPISLHVDAAPGCGGLAWPAGQILGSYLVQKGPVYIQDKTILELGSGTGLVGLVVGALGSMTTWITDQAPLLPIMNRNVLLNNLESNVSVAELNWGEPIPQDIPKPDIILAADCVYFEPAFPLLVQTLSDLSDPSTIILFCYKKRRKADKRFFNMLKKKFSWKEVMDDPNREVYNAEAITLMSLTKVK
ncbi:putative methyltransferase-domain-containing protein [Panaeolus papilionaceus]|nr:putative methyltransferase-domain-containing protein [Panaeolus papilionaceus]